MLLAALALRPLPFPRAEVMAWAGDGSGSNLGGFFLPLAVLLGGGVSSSDVSGYNTNNEKGKHLTNYSKTLLIKKKRKQEQKRRTKKEEDKKPI